MQTSVTPAPVKMSVTCGAAPSREETREKTAFARRFSSSCSSSVGQQRDEMALLLEEAQEHLRVLALAHRKQDEGAVNSSGSTFTQPEARETVCFLNLNGVSAGGLVGNGPTQTQLLSPGLSHRDLGPAAQ